MYLLHQGAAAVKETEMTVKLAENQSLFHKNFIGNGPVSSFKLPENQIFDSQLLNVYGATSYQLWKEWRRRMLSLSRKGP